MLRGLSAESPYVEARKTRWKLVQADGAQPTWMQERDEAVRVFCVWRFCGA